jgi:hypothetical protein
MCLLIPRRQRTKGMSTRLQMTTWSRVHRAEIKEEIKEIKERDLYYVNAKFRDEPREQMESFERSHNSYNKI